MWVAPFARAQTTITATVNASNDLTCMGTRVSTDLSCTAGEFSTIVSFNQPTATAITSCVAGSFISVDVIANISGTNADRYDAGLFFGQTGNRPEANNTGLCSVAAFPNTPSPFAEINTGVTPAGGDACGDYITGGVADLQINSIKVLCVAAPGSNQLSVPYAIAWSTQTGGGGPYACNAGNLIPKPNSKCLASPVGSSAILAGVEVAGWIRIIKNTTPSSITPSFSFSALASNPGGSLSTSAFTLSHAQAITISVPLVTATRVVTVTEALTTGWEPNTSISCVDPLGNPASFVTVDNANRRLVANLTGTNPNAICTVSNTKQARVRVIKTVLPGADTGTFNVSAQSVVTSTTALNVGTGGSTSYVPTTGGGTGTVTISETSAASTSMTKYISTVSCINDATLASVPLTSSTLTGATRSASLMPPQYTDVTCGFVNTRSANLSISKTNGTTTLVAGATTNYIITIFNAGPSDADGAVVRDPAAPGLECTAVTCTPSGAASCPAPLTIPLLQSGASIPTLPSGGGVSLTVSCGVTATGL